MSSDLPVTMQDIARALHINHSTVSRALSGRAGVSEPLKKKIEEMARQLGYRHDPMLAGLAHYRHRKKISPVVGEIAWLNLWPKPQNLWCFQEFKHYFEGASKTAEKHGYHLEEYIGEGAMTLERIEKILFTRNVQGIMVPPHPSLIDWGSFPWEKFSVIRFGYSLTNLSVDTVGSDQIGASMLAYRKIREKGYRRIGFVVNENAERNTLFRAGVLLAQAIDSSQPAIAPLVFPIQSDVKHKDKLKPLQTWLKRERPDAILTPIASLAEMLRELGYRTPSDVGLAVTSILDGKGDAGIDQHSLEIGRTAAEVLISLIDHNRRGMSTLPRLHLVPGTWVDGSMLPSKL